MKMTRNVSDSSALVTEITAPRIVFTVPRQASAQNVERVDEHLMRAKPALVHLNTFFVRRKRPLGAIARVANRSLEHIGT